MTHAIQLWPISSEDDEFLYRLYASTRAEELAIIGWSDEQKAAFLRMQFDAQHRFYQEHFAAASFDMVMMQGVPVGRLYVYHGHDEIVIVDIALLPEYCGRGVGSMLMQQVMAEAAAAGKPLRIHVELYNRALRLYERLGFRKIGDAGVYWHLEWLPPSCSDDRNVQP